jgi:hypothetical protein
MAHYNVSTLVDAAYEVEKTPPPAKVLPNEGADALFMLATLSAEISQEPVIKNEQQQQQELPASQVAPPTQVETPAPQVELNRSVTPIEPLSPKSAAMSLETPKSSPTKIVQAQVEIDQSTHRQETNGNATPREAETEITKVEPPAKVSSHRIMDILNDDVEVPVSKSRESQPPAREETPYTSPLLQRRTVESNHSASQNGSHREETKLRHHEQSDDQPMLDSEETKIACTSASPPRDHYWTNRGGLRDDSSLPKLNPIDRIREMLERKARNEGQSPQLNRREFRAPPNDYRQEGSSTRGDSNDRSQMPAPPLSRAFSPQERSNTAGRESRRPSVGGINASSSNGTQSYDQSPRTSHASFPPPPPRQQSQEHTSSYLDNGRRLSGSQASQAAQYGGGSAQPYPHDRNRSGPTPPIHQSPYPTPNTQNLPSISQSLPAKPPGPPPVPTKYRFAPYEPPRPLTYPHPQAAKYAPASHPSQSEPIRPGPHYPNPHHSGPQHHPASHQPPSHYPDPHRPGQSHNGPPPQQYSGSYNGGPPYQRYVPPVGTFTAPPPPPQAHPMPQYPPIKFQQYGGQPILPASMAPPHSHSQGPPLSQPGPPYHQQHGPPHSQPGPSHQQTLPSHSHLPVHSQPPHTQPSHAQTPHSAPPYSQGPPMPTYSQPPPNHMNPPTSGPPSYSPPAPGPLNPHYDHMQQNGPSDRPGESQQRPRRQYRSYHAPGTQFRTYQGPDTGGRRRGT